MTSWVLGGRSPSEPRRARGFLVLFIDGPVRSARLCSVFHGWVGGKGLMRPVPVYRRILPFPLFSSAACFPGHPLFSTDPAVPQKPCLSKPDPPALHAPAPLRSQGSELPGPPQGHCFCISCFPFSLGMVLSAFPPSPLLPSPLCQGFSGSLPRFLRPLACGGCSGRQGALCWHWLSFVCFLYLQITCGLRVSLSAMPKREV